MLELIRELYPICRSIAGEGIRSTIRRISRDISLDLVETPTGTPVFDWIVPREWSLTRATLRRTSGELLIDSDVHNLHVLNYSMPFAARVPASELSKHLHSLPDKPGWIPYRTSYYNPTWGLCAAHQSRSTWDDAEYDVDIDVKIAEGSLTYGEFVAAGESPAEVLFSCHACHPSLANDNLAGIAVGVELARWLSMRRNRLSYRIVFQPGTIGAITWLARNVENTKHIVAGTVLSCLGDAGVVHFKRPRRENSLTDVAMRRVLMRVAPGHVVRPFVPYGYDERQYCSPGFDLPIGCLMRTPNGEFPQYHTSGDDASIVSESSLEHSLTLLKAFVDEVESMYGQHVEPSRDVLLGGGVRYRSLNPHCEPMLGRRGLYSAMGGRSDVPQLQMALLWILNYADGRHGLDWIAERSAIAMSTIEHASGLLKDASLLTADQ
jgi:aminopeptidase-like protein